MRTAFQGSKSRLKAGLNAAQRTNNVADSSNRVSLLSYFSSCASFSSGKHQNCRNQNGVLGETFQHRCFRRIHLLSYDAILHCKRRAIWLFNRKSTDLKTLFKNLIISFLLFYRFQLVSSIFKVHPYLFINLSCSKKFMIS